MATFRGYSIVSSNDQEAAALAAEVYLGGENNYSLPLSSDGQEPATDYAQSAQLSDEQWDAQRTANATLAELYWKCSPNPRSPTLIETNCSASEARIGLSCKFDDALSDAGLQRIEPEE